MLKPSVFTSALARCGALCLALVAFGVAKAAEAQAQAPVPLHWLENKVPSVMEGVTWGVPWAKGTLKKETVFALQTPTGETIPLQSWPLATWPDGSLKWSALAAPATLAKLDSYKLVVASTPAAGKALATENADGSIVVDTGVAQTRLLNKGNVLVDSISRDGKAVVQAGRLVLLTQDKPEVGADGVVKQDSFVGEIGSVTLEQNGPVRAVVRVQGKHRSVNGDRAWLPFTVRLYFYAGSEAVRILHTIVFDGDEQKDFIRGLGLRFDVPMSGPLYDRHIRFAGEKDGLFAEAVQGLTGLRRDPGKAVTEAQLAGKATPAQSTWSPATVRGLQYVPTFGDWTLVQPTDGSFEIRKRTKEGYSWVKSAFGGRAGGLGYVGSPKGGLAFGIRNFWQSYPAQFDIRGATGDKAEVTLWLWAPEAGPMDLRFYHDGMGQDDYEKQNEGLEITYEDYEPGFGKPEGVARTSELNLWALPATPTRERLVELTEAVRTPAFLTVAPETVVQTGVFGHLISLPDRTNPVKASIEDRLDGLFDFYHKQTDERHWYGFWNYGDVMHTYDADRHTWRYDVGGFAWDNSELSTDLWLWLYYLRTGKAEVFRYAEAMTRHTGEVDVHHIGRFAPLGSRHNVMHWGCSAKQLRISTAQNRRYYYYLTADERVGDLMREQLEAARALVKIQPGRKVSARREIPAGAPAVKPTVTEDPNYANVGFGTDWGALSSAWLTEWERSGDPRIRDRLFNSMRSIAAQPHGFFSSGSRMNLETGVYDIVKNDRASASHLSAAFGLPEVCAELVELADIPEFNKAWLQYCRLYNATPEEQQAELGNPLKQLNLQQGHSKLTAFAGKILNQPELRQRAWKEFFRGEGGFRSTDFQPKKVTGPNVVAPVDEISMVSTNGTAQWGLAAIECLALAGDQIPQELPAAAPRGKHGGKKPAEK